MKCPRCETEMACGTTCPACEATWSEDWFDSSPESRTDTEHRISLGGPQMVMSRQDLKSLIALMILSLAALVIALIVFETGVGSDDLMTYLGVFILIFAAVIMARTILRSKGMRRWPRAVLVCMLILLVAGIAVVIGYQYMLSGLGPEDGSVLYVTEKTEEYQNLVRIGFYIGFSATLTGFGAILAARTEKMLARAWNQ